MKNSIKIIKLSNKMFKNSTSMVGDELKILNKTLRKQISNKPTSFKKELK